MNQDGRPPAPPVPLCNNRHRATTRCAVLLLLSVIALLRRAPHQRSFATSCSVTFAAGLPNCP
ncbi:hypothetical protein, partial [Burkholderia cepacia]|uniref:hypothetical protein n=1 Tax=Burkholderia cepacia TaxID=292 RepID=UPI002ABE4131